MLKRHFALLFFVLFIVLTYAGATPETAPVVIDTKLRAPFRFVAYGDTRFTTPANTGAADPEIRRRLVQAIADTHPSFVTFGGDIAYNGSNLDDWKIYDQETAVWRERKISVFPAFGNHDLRGNINTALSNFFDRFPDLKRNRFYTVKMANCTMLTLDSSLDETTGEQGLWLKNQIEHIPANDDFVFIVLHHPPYTSSTSRLLGGGHSSRSPEQRLAAYLEEQQKRLRARLVVFAGHVHNYERHQHGGVTYFVTGGGGAHPYLFNRPPTDLFQSNEVNYHYLLVEVENDKLKVTMNRLEIKDGKSVWTQPESVTIVTPKG